MGELSDGKICRKTCLFPFLADNPHSYIGDLDHTYVVATVADTAYSFTRGAFDQTCDFGFLCR